MADKEELIELLRNMPVLEIAVFGQRCGKAFVTAEFIADHLIANNVVIPIRCKDCKHCKKYRNRFDPMLNHQLCVRMDNYAWGVEEDDFCSYGERRTN